MNAWHPTPAAATAGKPSSPEDQFFVKVTNISDESIAFHVYEKTWRSDYNPLYDYVQGPKHVDVLIDKPITIRRDGSSRELCSLLEKVVNGMDVDLAVERKKPLSQREDLDSLVLRIKGHLARRSLL